MSDFRQAFENFVATYRDDPVGFVEEVLKAKPLPWQADLLRAVAAGERRISVRAGHGVGKSTCCSWLLLWHMLTRFPQKAVVTAPTAGQLFDALFSELKHWATRAAETYTPTAYASQLVMATYTDERTGSTYYVNLNPGNTWAGNGWIIRSAASCTCS